MLFIRNTIKECSQTDPLQAKNTEKSFNKTTNFKK